jgi:hypothetical protein
MDQALPCLKRAAQALQKAHDNPPDSALDVEVQESIIALMDCLRQLSAQEDENPIGRAREELAIQGATAVFQIIGQESKAADSATRLSELSAVLVQAIADLAPFAYSVRSQANLRTHVQLFLDCRPHHDPQDKHIASAFGVCLNGVGVILPHLQNSPPLRELAASFQLLENKASAVQQGSTVELRPLHDSPLHKLIREVAKLLTQFFKDRSGFVEGVPYGITGWNTPRHDPAMDLEEMFRVFHSQRGFIAHHARAYVLKLAQYLLSVLGRQVLVSNPDFCAVQDAAQVCWSAVPCAAFYAAFILNIFSVAHRLKRCPCYATKFPLQYWRKQ